MTLDRILQATVLLSNGIVAAYVGKLPAYALVLLAALGIAASVLSKRVVASGVPNSPSDIAGQVVAVLAQAIPAAVGMVRDVCTAESQGAAEVIACVNYSLPAWAVIACATAGALFGVTSHGLGVKQGPAAAKS